MNDFFFSVIMYILFLKEEVHWTISVTRQKFHIVIETKNGFLWMRLRKHVKWKYRIKTLNNLIRKVIKKIYWKIIIWGLFNHTTTSEWNLFTITKMFTILKYNYEIFLSTERYLTYFESENSFSLFNLYIYINNIIKKKKTLFICVKKCNPSLLNNFNSMFERGKIFSFKIVITKLQRIKLKRTFLFYFIINF